MVNLNNQTENSQETLIENWNSPSCNQDLRNDILANKVITAIKTLKAGKAPGPDNLHPEFFLHFDEKCFEWLRILFSNCYPQRSFQKCGK